MSKYRCGVKINLWDLEDGKTAHGIALPCTHTRTRTRNTCGRDDTSDEDKPFDFWFWSYTLVGWFEYELSYSLYNYELDCANCCCTVLYMHISWFRRLGVQYVTDCADRQGGWSFGPLNCDRYRQVTKRNHSAGPLLLIIIEKKESNFSDNRVAYITQSPNWWTFFRGKYSTGADSGSGGIREWQWRKKQNKTIELDTWTVEPAGVTWKWYPLVMYIYIPIDHWYRYYHTV